jgi:hypothetical protein
MSRDERQTLIDASQSLRKYSESDGQETDFHTFKLIQLQLATATIIIERDLIQTKLKTKRG